MRRFLIEVAINALVVVFTLVATIPGVRPGWSCTGLEIELGYGDWLGGQELTREGIGHG